MLESGKFCSSAAIATALTVSGGNQISLNDNGAKLPLHLSNERYTCNPDNLYAVPRTDLHETEWTQPNSIEAEISRFVTDSSATTTARNYLRRCRTSTSSGYSSHSPPLSTGSYSCYASAVCGQNFFRNVPLTMKDQFGGNLAVIHESEAIPRPIWPSSFPTPRQLYHNDESPEYDALYTCWGCSCTYTSSYCDWNCDKSAGTSAHEVLLELSRTLNSVLDGENIMTPEEILQNISHKVAQGIGTKGGVYEYVYHNSFLPKKSFANEKSSCLLNCNKNTSSKINPINSKLYSNTRHFYIYNPAWYSCLCTCGHNHRFVSSLKTDQVVTNNELEKKESSTAAVLVNDYYQGTNSWSILENDKNTSESNICECLKHSTDYIKTMQNMYDNHHVGIDTKKAINVNEGTKNNRNKIVSNESEYVMLETGYSDSINEDMVFSSRKSNWDYRMQGFIGDLDFTLDVSRAERLGRAIAKAKRKRQWCRTLTAFFGLVFFILSVVIVSLSVTRGRKIFGSI
ncbi:uncharacterized protein LOC100882808 isoform X2 [Megachile rotundata]|uniref:uncharacterized protein LOC100882808 isoform X2 n=1 Tax=Megachile rotundata TaxID=143995 RepID=UPI000614B674|nr:PREDICTED: uncharacterized protein LOC100882808 isoform X2 [Megachile rotundata]